MGIVYLIRHGQAGFGEVEYDRLSPLGARQAELLGAELVRRRLAVGAVVCGSLSRQRATAAGLVASARLAVEPVVDERWNEYDHLEIVRHHGVEATDPADVVAADPDTDRAALSRSFQGALDVALLRWAEALDEDLAADETYDILGAPPKLETWSEFHRRVRAAWSDVVAAQQSGTATVVVSSGGVISALCAHILGMRPEGFVAFNRVSVNGGITKVLHGRSGDSLLTFNDHAYLEIAGRDLVTYR